MSVEKLVISKEMSSFTTLPNNVLQNLRNADALGLWVYLASLPPSWQFYKDQIREHFGIGRDKLEKLIFILREHNLLTIESVRDAQGRFVHWHMHILCGDGFAQVKTQEESSTSYCASPLPENPVTGKPRQWKTAAINKTNNKSKKKEINKTSCASEEARKSFALFYALYPIKKNRKRAEEVWIKNKLHEAADNIIDKLRLQIKEDDQWKNSQFIPHPVTYLRNEYYNDEVERHKGEEHPVTASIRKLKEQSSEFRDFLLS